jgi:hypothetical protein
MKPTTEQKRTIVRALEAYEPTTVFLKASEGQVAFNLIQELTKSIKADEASEREDEPDEDVFDDDEDIEEPEEPKKSRYRKDKKGRVIKE